MINDEILRIKDVIVGCIDCEQVYLFGSHAYGNPTVGSDYDFYVVLRDDPQQKPIAAIQTIHRHLIDFDTMIPVDVLANYKSRFEYRSKQPTLERKIVRDGVLLYDRYLPNQRMVSFCEE
jgi:predicted nucleotidyltransferase